METGKNSLVVKLFLASSFSSFHYPSLLFRDRPVYTFGTSLTEFIKNVTTWHSSDTTAVKNMTTMTSGQVIYAPLNKVKDYPETNDYHNDLAISGWNVPVEGFKSFLYKMWIMIPSTSKLPYTACLFIEFFSTPEGFTSGWDSEGYYSVNPETPAVEGDHTLVEWQEDSIIEDINYINSVYKEASTYIRSLVTV